MKKADLSNAKKNTVSLIVLHSLLAFLVIVVTLVPNTRSGVKGFGAMLVGLAVIELLFIVFYRKQRRKGKRGTGPIDILSVIWIFLIIWEFISSKWDKVQPVLFPCPENVFLTFALQWKTMLLNVVYSLELLLAGFFIGLIAAVFLGMLAGWFPRFREFSMPIAHVLAPIPAIVISPYLVCIMPTFRSASLIVILLGVFWPNFLSTVNRICNMEPQILDSARMMNPDTKTMIMKILLPYIFPSVVGGLKISLTTSMLMLNFAELMGATRGMGFYVQNSIAYANYTQAVAGIIVIGIVVTVLSFVVDYFQKVLVRWK